MIPVTWHYSHWHLHCFTLNTCHSTIQTLALNVACTSNTCHFTVQTLAPTLLVLWMPVTSQYRHWHLHCLCCEHLSLHSADADTYIAYTESACHYCTNSGTIIPCTEVQTLAPLLLVLRIHVTSQYQHSHHHFLCMMYGIWIIQHMSSKCVCWIWFSFTDH